LKSRGFHDSFNVSIEINSAQREILDVSFVDSHSVVNDANQESAKKPRLAKAICILSAQYQNIYV
jgi:hypothetical protein